MSETDKWEIIVGETGRGPKCVGQIFLSVCLLKFHHKFTKLPPFPPPLLDPKPPFVWKLRKLNIRATENRFMRVLSEKYGDLLLAKSWIIWKSLLEILVLLHLLGLLILFTLFLIETAHFEGL